MEISLILGAFSDENALRAAARATARAGYGIHDVYCPYPVHGLEDGFGGSRSRLPWVCLGFGMAGLLLAGLGQLWIGAIDWPLNVGGKPLNSLPAYLPLMFEATVLLAGIGAAVALCGRARLYPGKRAWVPDPRATNDRFVLALESKAPDVDREVIERLWRPFGVDEVRTVRRLSP
jgi:hypothetical protein